MPTPLINRIAEQRRARNMTQQQLAHALGVSQQQLSEWERGVKKPAVDVALEIARALACRVEDIFML
jgi:DNA-binding XRE family transcriptional regulator